MSTFFQEGLSDSVESVRIAWDFCKKKKKIHFHHRVATFISWKKKSTSPPLIKICLYFHKRMGDLFLCIIWMKFSIYFTQKTPICFRSQLFVLHKCNAWRDFIWSWTPQVRKNNNNKKNSTSIPWPQPYWESIEENHPKLHLLRVLERGLSYSRGPQALFKMSVIFLSLLFHLMIETITRGLIFERQAKIATKRMTKKSPKQSNLMSEKQTSHLRDVQKVPSFVHSSSPKAEARLPIPIRRIESWGVGVASQTASAARRRLHH